MNKSEVYAGDTCFSSLIQFSLFKFWIWIFTLTHFIEVTLKMVEIFRACYKIASFWKLRTNGKYYQLGRIHSYSHP